MVTTASAQHTHLTKKTNKISLAYRLQVLLRFIAAIVGGYALTSVSISLFALLLPLNKLDAVLLMTTLSVFFYSCIFIWVFTVRSLKRIWITILLTFLSQLLVLALLKGWL